MFEICLTRERVCLVGYSVFVHRIKQISLYVVTYVPVPTIVGLTTAICITPPRVVGWAKRRVWRADR